MSGKTVPMSVRLSHADAEFLARLSIAGAVTPSEKLRAVLAETRRRHEGQQDFAGCVTLIEDMLSPALGRLREQELNRQMHSEFLAKLYSWLPAAAALLVTGIRNDGENGEALGRLEASLADRVFSLIEASLRLGLTTRSPCYDPGLIAERVDGVLELAELIGAKRNQKERNLG